MNDTVGHAKIFFGFDAPWWTITYSLFGEKGPTGTGYIAHAQGPTPTDALGAFLHYTPHADVISVVRFVPAGGPASAQPYSAQFYISNGLHSMTIDAHSAAEAAQKVHEMRPNATNIVVTPLRPGATT